jgi:hypothetical protein
MSLETSLKIRTFQRKLYCKAKVEPAFRFYLLSAGAEFRIPTGVWLLSWMW